VYGSGAPDAMPSTSLNDAVPPQTKKLHIMMGSCGSPRNTRQTPPPGLMTKLLSYLSALLATSVTFSQSAPATAQPDPRPHAASPQLAAQFGTGSDTGSVTASSSGTTISLNRQNSMKHRYWATFGKGGPTFLHQASTPTTPHKINLQKLSHFSSCVCCHFQPANHHNSTTIHHHFHHDWHPRFSKTPAKNHNPP
jgi:hypothetical protein